MFYNRRFGCNQRRKFSVNNIIYTWNASGACKLTLFTQRVNMNLLVVIFLQCKRWWIITWNYFPVELCTVHALKFIAIDQFKWNRTKIVLFIANVLWSHRIFFFKVRSVYGSQIAFLILKWIIPWFTIANCTRIWWMLTTVHEKLYKNKHHGFKHRTHRIHNTICWNAIKFHAIR